MQSPDKQSDFSWIARALAGCFIGVAIGLGTCALGRVDSRAFVIGLSILVLSLLGLAVTIIGALGVMLVNLIERTNKPPKEPPSS